MIYVHIVPAFGVFVNTVISRVVFIFSHVKFMTMFGVAYLVVNFVAVQIKGAPLYHFLPWNDFMSYVISLAIIAFASISYFIVCSIIQTVKQKPSEYKHQQNKKL